MKSVLSLAFAILLAGTLSFTEANAQKTSAGYDKSANFSSYKTFMFSETNGARNPFVNEMIMTAVVRELTARGLTRVDANPDLRFRIWRLRVLIFRSLAFRSTPSSIPPMAGLAAPRRQCGTSPRTRW